MKSTADIWRALLDGEIIWYPKAINWRFRINKDSDLLEYSSNYGETWEDSKEAFLEYEDFQIYHPPKWEDTLDGTIKNAVLCWIIENGLKRIEYIISYDDRVNITHKYASNEKHYRIAAPLTPAEVEQFKVNAEKIEGMK